MGWDIVAIGTNHNLPVKNPIKTAERIAPLVDGPISVGYYESWIFNPMNNGIVASKEFKWIEIKKINPQKKGQVVLFSIEDYCARKIYLDHQSSIDSINFVDKNAYDRFISDATDEPFALYECDTQERPFFDLQIHKQIVNFTENFHGRWFQFVESLKNPQTLSNKYYILDFRKYIFQQLKICGCDKAYYFADQGPGQWLYDIIDKSAKEWVDYLETGVYVENQKPMIVEIQKLLDGSLILSEDDWVDCFIDDFSDLSNT